MSQPPPAYLAQLDAIDETYWWHRVRWRVVRHCLRRFGGSGAFPVYFDIGSGGGGLPALLVNDFACDRIVLFDARSVLASKIPHPNVTQQVVDLDAFQFHTNGLPSPDLVTCLDILEHLKDPGHLLQSLKRLSMGRRTTLIATVPALPSLWSSWDEAAGHCRRYTRRELCRLLSEAGWTVPFCRYVFQAAVPFRWVQRKRAVWTAETLRFPAVPPWLNRMLEAFFWSEFLAMRRWPLPLGLSLVAVAHTAEHA